MSADKKTKTDIQTVDAPNDNSPVFIDPCQGGPNPFEDTTPTEVDDRPSDEFISDDGDIPGEGIHF